MDRVHQEVGLNPGKLRKIRKSIYLLASSDRQKEMIGYLLGVLIAPESQKLKTECSRISIAADSCLLYTYLTHIVRHHVVTCIPG